MPVLLIMMTASALHSQDTTKVWIPRTDALRVLAQADSMKVYKKLVSQKQADIDTLTQRIDALQNVITQLKAKDATNQSIVSTYENQVKEMTDIRTEMQNEINYWQKLFLKEKRKRFWTTVGGIIGIGAAIYFFK